MDPDAPHLRPWPRGPYLAVLVGVILVLLTWIVLAISELRSGAATGRLCALVAVGLLLVGSALPLAIWRRRGITRSKSTLGGNEDALALLRGARYEEAAEVWNDLCHRTRHSPALHALYVVNLGVTFVHLGRFRQGRTLIERARASGWLGSPALAHVDVASRVALALSLALSDELDAARAMMAELEPRVSGARRAVIMLARAVIAVRSGEEVAFDSDALRQAESSLMISHVRALRLLEAFARSSGAAGSAYREGADRTPIDAIGIRPGELDFLSAEWPALRAFMEPRGLLAQPR